MVKISNPLGDVKVGRQGEAVYQRKYGEQIRRTVSPKRAISSEAQIAHRQVYRDALAWRSQLSLANRRYLEGYCIANGVVDGYGVPLAWSRFALKLYLQAVSFVVIEKPILTYTKTAEKFEFYEEESELTDDRFVYQSLWSAQAFTPLKTHDLTKLELYLSRFDTIGTVTVSIRATDGAGKPTGGDLASTSFDGMELGTSDAWFEIPLFYHELVKDIKYAYVVRLAGGGNFNRVNFITDKTAPTYPRGTYCNSVNSGASWTVDATRDAGFREFGEYETEERTIGLIHVRHPALLAIVHKRGEINVNGYDTLSSLDGEYLTKQVGLDVHVGDSIEATTLPGVDYPYLVK